MKFQFPIFHKKELVITIHGFGRRTLHEMDPLAHYLEKNGFEVWRFAYYDPDNLKDVDYHDWIARCEAKMRKAIDEKRTIHLLGFSMGGVVASYLASVYPVKDLLLCAPAFYPIDFSKIEKAARSKLLSSGSESSSMSSEQTRTFLSIVSRYRNSITQVDCPILIMHGTGDEVIQSRSSRRIFAAIPNPHKYLVFLEGARHRFLYDGAYESLAFPIIRDYFRGEIHPQIYPPEKKAEKKPEAEGKESTKAAREEPARKPARKAARNKPKSE